MSFRKGLIAAACLAALAAGAAAPVHADAVSDAISARQAGMKKNGADGGAIKKALDAGADLKPLAANAQEIADFAARLPTLYPPGSGPESGLKTRALPAIWQNKPDFDKHAANLQAAAARLVVALNSGDKAQVLPAFQAMGQACGACHETYRSK